MAFGPTLDELWRRAAGSVDRILKGAAPATMAVAQPTRCDVYIIARAAQSFGIIIPSDVGATGNRGDIQ
jgi:putative ABC transport system substrate-binding protein